MTTAPIERRSAPEPLRWVLPLTVGAVAAGSVLLLVAPGLQFVIVAPGLDTVLNTTTTLVAGAVVAFGWTRFQERRQPADLLETAAFLALFASDAVSIVVPLMGYERALGMSLESPGQEPLYIWGLGRLIVAGTLVLAAAPRHASIPTGVRAGVVGLAPTLAFGAMAVIVVLAGSRLPELVGPDGLVRLRADPVVSSGLPGVTLLGAGLQLAGASLFIVGAVLCVQRYREGEGVRRAYLAVGFVLAAFSQLHGAIYPGTYTSLVTTADVLRLAFYAILLLGVQAEARADLRALRRANRELETLREAEAVGAALEERARLAREIHDGLAQDLWFAKLKIERAARLPGLDAEVAALVAEVTTAVDSGLANARQAVLAMRTDVLGGSLVDMLSRYVEEFGDGCGLRVEMTADATVPDLSPRRQAELLRIAQEALNNVRKHADATVVRVTISCHEGRLRISIADNGRGFQPDSGQLHAYGLQSMRERVTGIGGQLTIASRPHDGTTVVVDLPVDEAGST